jgi:hypothetical protein
MLALRGLFVFAPEQQEMCVAIYGRRKKESGYKIFSRNYKEHNFRQASFTTLLVSAKLKTSKDFLKFIVKSLLNILTQRKQCFFFNSYF